MRSARPVWLGVDKRKWDHVRIHLQLLEDSRLGAYELGVYMGLAAHAETQTGKCFPAASTLASYMNVNERTVRRSLKKLRDAGYIEVKREKGQASTYYLLPLPTLDSDPGLTVQDPGLTVRTSPDSQSDEQEPIEQEPITRGVVEREIPRSEPSGGLPMMVKSTDGRSTVKPMFWPALAAKTATEVLDNASTPGQPKLTPRERKALRPQVIEWLQAGWSPEALSAAIAASPFKTPNAVGGELRKQQSPVSGQAKKSVGDSNLEAAARFLERHSEESK